MKRNQQSWILEMAKGLLQGIAWAIGICIVSYVVAIVVFTFAADKVHASAVDHIIEVCGEPGPQHTMVVGTGTHAIYVDSSTAPPSDSANACMDSPFRKYRWIITTSEGGE